MKRLRTSLVGALAILAVLSPMGASHAEEQELQLESDRVTKPSLRDEWFRSMRADEQGKIPEGAFKRARDQMQKTIAEGTLAPLTGAGTWIQHGPAPIAGTGHGTASGRIRSIAAVSPSVIYLGAASGGVWRTTNGGQSWAPLTDDQPSLAMGSVAVDPSSPQVVYAGTGEYAWTGFSYYGAGILKSTDGGVTWAHIPGPWDTLAGGAAINKVLVIPGPSSADPTDDVVLVAGSHHLYRSEQGGIDFAPSSTPVLTGNISDVAVSPDNPYVLFAAKNGTGVYRSFDGGRTWDADPSDPDVDPLWAPGVTQGGCTLRRGAVAPAPTNSDYLYAVFEAVGCNDGSGLVFRSTNALAAIPSFTQLTTPRYPTGHVWAGASFCRGQCRYDLAIIVQPYDPDGSGPLAAENVVYVGGVGFFRTTDGGSSWTNIGEPPWGVHVDLHAFAFDPAGALLVSSDGGIYRHPSPAFVPSVDTWDNLNTNLGLTQLYGGMAVHPTSTATGKTTVLGGSQDNGMMRRVNGVAWQEVFVGDGGASVFDHSNPDDTWYVSAQNNYILKTTNDGLNLFLATNGLPRAGLFITPLQICPDDADVLLASDDHGVYRTDDGAANWYDNSQRMTELWHQAPEVFAFVPGTGCNTYFAGTRASPVGRVFRTTTGGGTGPIGTDWQSIGNGLPLRIVSGLAVNPTNGNDVVVSLAGFCGHQATCPAGSGQVWRTTTALQPNPVWQDLTGGKGLPNAPAFAVVRDPSNPSHIYYGTDVGVFGSTDAGASWGLVNRGLPNAAVTNLVFNSDQELLAGTFGRSVFRMVADIDADAVPDDIDNCPAVSNPGQTDSDGDGLGDACDACQFDPSNDADTDGHCGSEDCAPLDPTLWSAPENVAGVTVSRTDDGALIEWWPTDAEGQWLNEFEIVRVGRTFATCPDAFGVTVPGSVDGSTVGSVLDPTVPFCGISVDAPGRWYTVIGTGETLTATTCVPETDFDTKLNVYCDDCATSTCIAGNDDQTGGSDPACDTLGIGFNRGSTVSWCSEAGVNYKILVQGYAGATGDYGLTVTSAPGSCANPIACEVDIDECPTPYASEVPTRLFAITSGASSDVPPAFGCGTSVSAPGVWLSVLGTGRELTATTCDPGTNYDTKLNVYCDDCEDLVCIGGNDDQFGGFDPACDVLGNGINRGSTVTWCSEGGATYRIFVQGYGGQTGQAILDVSESGACASGGPGCLDEARCFGTLGETWIVDDEIPPPGEYFGYLVRGWNDCGAGTWGDGSSFRGGWTCSAPDLAVVPGSSYCRISGFDLEVIVENRGNRAAEASTTKVIFENGHVVTLSTPPLGPGQATSVFAPFPSGCFDPDCSFEIHVDDGNVVQEDDESNNSVHGGCLG